MRTIKALAVHAGALRGGARRRGGAGGPLKATMGLGAPLAASTKVFAGANAVGLGISLVSDTHVHLDLIGTGAFALAAHAARGASASAAARASTGMVAAWATRLAGFLFYRAVTGGKDARLTETLSTGGGCVAFWAFSFAWGVLTSLPHVLGASAGNPGASGPALRRAGAALFAVGLLTEVVADAQKFAFKRANPGKFCDVGVWAASQHPNWFGNLLLWSGISLFNAPGLAPASLALAALSPLSLLALFNAQATGALTPTVALAQARYGGDAAFVKYVAETPLLIPNPLALLSALAKSLAPGL